MNSVQQNSSITKNLVYWKNKIIIGAVSFFALQSLFFITLYNINFPYSMDHLGINYLYDYILSGNFPYEELFIGSHSGHLLLFSRLIALPNLLLNSFDVANLFYFQWIFVSISLFFTYLLIQRTDQRINWILIPVSAFVYSPLINSNYWAFAIFLWYLPPIGITITIYIFFRKKINFKLLTAAITAAIFATFSSIIGIVAWIPVFLYALKTNFEKKWLVIFLTSMVLIGILYNFIVPQSDITTDFTALFSVNGFSFIATYLSSPFRVKYDFLMITIGIITMTLSFFCTYYFVVIRKKIQTVLTWLAFLLVGYSAAIITALGRVSLEFHKGNEPYYIPISQFIQIGLLVLVSLMILDIKSNPLNSRKKILLVILYAIIISQMILLVPSYYAGWWRGDYYFEEKSQHISCFSLYNDADCVLNNGPLRMEANPVIQNLLLEKKFSIFSNNEFNIQNKQHIQEFEQTKNNSNEKFFGLGEIETVNGIGTFEQQSFSLEKPVLIITGWSLDQNHQQLDNLYLLVDGEPFLKYDDFISRDDIAKNHNFDSSQSSGWIISFLSGYLEEGCHNLSLASLKNQQIIMFEQVVQICKN